MTMQMSTRTGVVASLKRYCETGPEGRSRNGRILMLGQASRRPLCEAFETQGFEVLHLGSAAEAIDHIRAGDVTMVITGGGRSKSAGRNLLASLSSQGRRAEVPVVWLGSGADNQDSLLRSGVSLFLRAPYAVDSLVSMALFTL